MFQTNAKKPLYFCSMPKAHKILSNSGLRHTKPRIEILDLFTARDYAISQGDIEKLLAEKVDRVTIYRTLSTFEEKGIIHEVVDGSSQSKFALCAASCTDHKHTDSHVHFKCENCEKTYCLEDIETPNVSVPFGFTVNNSAYLLQGVCNNCKPNS